MSQAFKTFKFIRKHQIESLDLTVEQYEHVQTGALHYHLAADNAENVFMVALRTVPMDSTGVAHILEHTALCGSERYPVRDPFFMMIRRSLNTFMNAFTSSDWTAYPFASENKKDFQNLLQVYMDAVFFPNLDPLDFAQEGHRLGFSEMENPESQLEYKGVVFNEMKGAMSSQGSVLWQAFSEALYPTNTYHFNSGGEPRDIPDLSYEDFVEFHKHHYHPSNAVFMTFGDISAATHQANFETLALSRFEDQVPVIKVAKEQRLEAPQRHSKTYALEEDEVDKKTHIVMGWLLGENKEPMDVLKGHLLSAVLLDNSASPLRQVLETTALAEAPSRLCGFDDSNREMVFAVGVQGSEAEHTDAIESLIINELKQVVENGIDQTQVDAMLHQLELSQREIGGDGYPYGLQLILQSLSGAMHDGDPIALLDTDQALKQLSILCEDARFIPNLIQAWILDNPHRITLTLSPDQKQAEREAEAEKAKLNAIQTALSEEEKQAIVKLSLDLEARQNQEDDLSILPEVTKEDVPADLKTVKPVQTSQQPHYDLYEVGTNGLSYQQCILDLPDLTEKERQVLPLFNACLTEIGADGSGYLETQMKQALLTGGIATKSSIRSDIHSADKFHAKYILSGKALNRNSESLSQILMETLQSPNFSETDRIKDLIGQVRSSIDQGVTGNGHSHAMMAANQNQSITAHWRYERQGFAGIKTIKNLYDDIQSPAGLDGIISNFESIQKKLLASKGRVLVVSDSEGIETAKSSMLDQFGDFVTVEASHEDGFSLVKPSGEVKQAWVTSTQVNFCAKSYQAVPFGHPDAPKLAVLGALLRNGFLHSAVREKGGAYGGGASFDAESSAFCFYSYRDPRLLETYDDFDKSFDWLRSKEATQEKVNEAILNIISSMDKPGSPAGEAKKAFYQKVYGRDYALLMSYRTGVLETTIDELRALADQYFGNQSAAYAVLTNESGAKLVEDQQFEVIQL